MNESKRISQRVNNAWVNIDAKQNSEGSWKTEWMDGFENPEKTTREVAWNAIANLWPHEIHLIFSKNEYFATEEAIFLSSKQSQ